MSPDRARVLAQLASEGGPVHPNRVAAAIAPFDVEGITADLRALTAAGLAVELRSPGRGRSGMGSVVYYEATLRGRLEATGGAQTSLLPRPPATVQPALF